MRITSHSGADASAPATAAAPGAGGAEAPAPGAPAPAAGALQSAVLQPALETLREMPDIDHAKVAALREALARGEVPFDAGKLAGLIERYHGNRG